MSFDANINIDVKPITSLLKMASSGTTKLYNDFIGDNKKIKLVSTYGYDIEINYDENGLTLKDNKKDDLNSIFKNEIIKEMKNRISVIESTLKKLMEDENRPKIYPLSEEFESSFYEYSKFATTEEKKEVFASLLYKQMTSKKDLITQRSLKMLSEMSKKEIEFLFTIQKIVFFETKLLKSTEKTKSIDLINEGFVYSNSINWVTVDKDIDKMIFQMMTIGLISPISYPKKFKEVGEEKFFVCNSQVYGLNKNLTTLTFFRLTLEGNNILSSIGNGFKMDKKKSDNNVRRYILESKIQINGQATKIFYQQ